MSHNTITKIADAVLPPDVPLIFQTNSGNAVAAANIIEILGGAGATTSGVGNVITIDVTAASFAWNVVTSVGNPHQLVKQNGYICDGVALVTFLLPLAPVVGDSFKIFSYTSRFQIIPNGGQNMVVGAATGILGALGTVTSNSPGDAVTFVYMGGNTFQSEPPQGTLTVTTS